MIKPGSLRIFVVEDDEWYREFITYILSLDPELEVKAFGNGKDLLRSLDENPDIVTVDYLLPDTDGISLIKQIKAYNPDIETLVISQQEKVEKAVELIKLGIYDYCVKSDDLKEKLLNAVHNIARNKALKIRVNSLEAEVKHKYSFENTMIGDSEPIRKVFALLEKASIADIPVLISGETGTGKEVVAKAIHYNSRRKKAPLVTVNMATIPHDLGESELFGHEKGAFTGAIASRPGKFEMADKGTIFLDEIGEMDLNMQAKLLRVLQEKEVERVGGNKIISVDCRIITATNKNLLEEVRKGNFREDLYYRIYGLPIELPPLRERGNDIILLGMHFLDLFCKENSLKTKNLSSDARQKLLSHTFPGNVRELKSVVELSVILSSGDEISAADITLNGNHHLPGMLQEEKTLDEYIQHILKFYLRKYDDNVQLVSQKLNLGKSTIYKMLKEHKAFFEAPGQDGFSG
ncbi:MAG TPA: sigma-54 dependent transcriptional regulator [Bacteroidia bacterium]|jgi:two-component system response regulator AtoC|nr:sigma-54 dependent transcriptional regulator [Bacteroidia bacterium]